MAESENINWKISGSVKSINSDSSFRGADDFSDSLHGYLRKISTLPPLPEEEQSLLVAEIGNRFDSLRKTLAHFPFIIQDVLTHLREQLEKEKNIHDFFVISSLRRDKDKDESLTASQIDEKINNWIAECSKALEELGNKVKNNASSPEIQQARDMLAQSFNTLDIAGERVEYYCAALKDHYRIGNAGSNKNEPENSSSCFVPPPDENRVNDLLKQLNSDYDTLMELKDRMIESNLRLVIRIAQSYRHRGVPFNDLIQEGNLGLMRALVKFDAKLGNRFSTYASWWIRHNISRSIAEQARVIRVPMHMFATINAINRAEEQFVLEHEREPEPEELAEILSMSLPKLNAIRKMARQTISLQSPIAGRGEGASLEDFIAETRNADPTENFAKRIAYSQLEKMLDKLSERDRQIIIMRFGLFNQPQLTAMEVGRRMNLSRERIRQIELNVMTILRNESKFHLDDCIQND